MIGIILTEIQLQPGIDTPLVCLRAHSHDIVDPGYRENELAMWLCEWHREAWQSTCSDIDKLIEGGIITFSDDGELHAII